MQGQVCNKFRCSAYKEMIDKKSKRKFSMKKEKEMPAVNTEEKIIDKEPRMLTDEELVQVSGGVVSDDLRKDTNETRPEQGEEFFFQYE